jgi:small subunit ribosomal protein S1
MILKIDTQQQRISLGLRQTQPDPWSSLPDRYPPGTEVTGPVTGITDFGVFMEIEEGIEGLVHISELSHDHIEDIAQHFNKGDEVTAVILNIDPVEQRASLSRKRMLPFTPENAAEFGGNTPPAGAGRDRAGGYGASAGGYSAGGAGAGGQGAGARRGRRGRRGGSDIDYDYSYVTDAASTKTTTKLGDVYADLFAQFGLTDTKADEPTKETKAAASTADAVLAAGDAAGAEGAATVAGSVNESDVAAVVADATETKPAPKQQPTKAAEEPVDPANAIDAAEAAALLTAAFRQGKRPAAQPDDTANAYADVEPEADEPEAEADSDHDDSEEETHA